MDAYDAIIMICLYVMSMATAYLYALAIIGIFGKKKASLPPVDFDFLILVPAHNEAAVIETTLKSLKRLRPIGNIEIAVIADNCTDNTALLARRHNVTVWERNNPDERGKGYALNFGLSRYDLNKFNAVAIVDADTIVKPDMLEIMAASLCQGCGAVQVSYEMTAATNTPLAWLQHMASMAENIFFYHGRSVIGLPVLLRGTGMALASDVLKKHPWKSYSITEDVDYAVDLIKAGVKIEFTVNTSVSSPAASTYAQSSQQKTRWASGTFGLIIEKSFSLIKAAIVQRRPILMELALSFWLLSRPLLIFICFLLFGVSLAASPGLNIFFTVWAAMLILLLILYLIGGILFLEDKKPALKALLHLPFWSVWFFMIQIKALFSRGKSEWVRTDRET